MPGLRRLTPAVLLVVLAAAAGAQARPDAAPSPLVEVVVALDAPPLAQAAIARSPAARRSGRLSLRSPAGVSYVRTLASAQRTLAARIQKTVPNAAVRWRYQVVANGLAVVVPAVEVARLERLPGVRTVYPSVRYHPLLDRSPAQIGAPALWGPTLATAGQGLKIGIIDDGIDQRHPFFSPAGYTMPAGFPKGQTAYTTPKVIAARAFPPPSPSWKYADRPFDPDESSHATHVAGIAAGNNGTSPGGTRPTVSGVAPRAYLGNYKALTIPTDSGVGPDGNSPELVAAIEAAVKDGMDVLNLSLGEAEIEPSRDVVALALDAAAALGVVPVVAVGNEFEDFGRGSASSPGTSSRAITAGAVTTSRGGPAGIVADFSSSGPTPISLRLKPDVAAPGVAILSSVPSGWSLLSGTSMASPHVAGAVALLRQRHPNWTPDQIRSALTQTGDPAFLDDGRTQPAPPTRVGGGVINLVRADVPLLFADPSKLSFGFVGRGATASRNVVLSDAGGGAGDWVATVDQSALAGVSVTVPPVVSVPGTLAVSVDTTAAPADGEVTGYVVLTRGADRRRIPFWLRVTRPALANAKTTPLTKPGLYRGDTRGRPALASQYRYPDNPAGFGFASTLAGPEQIFRVRVRGRIANFGVVITQRARGVKVEPRIVRAGDENRLMGLPALPFNNNPYLRGLGDVVLASGVVRPQPGFTYDVVFDSGTPAGAGAFRFRFWWNDQRPPTISVPVRSVARGRPLAFFMTDAGSGVDPATLRVTLDGRVLPARPQGGRVRIATGALARGRHSLRIQVSDYQETRNMENSGRILANTRVVTTSFVVR
jgi:subtilisin family serine protease